MIARFDFDPSKSEPNISRTHFCKNLDTLQCSMTKSVKRGGRATFLDGAFIEWLIGRKSSPEGIDWTEGRLF